MLKRAAEKWRRENRSNILVCCLVMCLDCIYALIEYISRFAMIQASMTGEAFCDAARTVSDLLSRNFLLAYGSYVFPQSILGFTVLVLSAFFGYNAYLLSSFGYDIADDIASANTSSIVIGVLCFVVSYIVLNFFIMILLNVIDAVFVCYAVDKDRSAVNHPELHQVFDEVTAKQRARGKRNARRWENLYNLERRPSTRQCNIHLAFVQRPRVPSKTNKNLPAPVTRGLVRATAGHPCGAGTPASPPR